jgi:nucleotide-binding universal stress UspA family protein
VIHSKTIIVPTDFSSAATNAAHYAAEMAVAIKANLLLLHVYSLPVVYSEMPVVINDSQLVKDYETALAVLKHDLLQKTNFAIKIDLELRTGTFFAELKAVCNYRKPYTVVMGSQGTSEVERMLFGSHTVYAMKHLMAPLITVPPGVKFSSLNKIGLACDFDKVVDTTPVDEIKLLVTDFNAELHLLNTGEAEVFDPGLVYEFGLLRQMLDSVKPHFHYISNKNTDQAIIDFAETNELDLLVIMPRRHSLLDKLVRKSHTRQLVLHSHVPVMALHQEIY